MITEIAVSIGIDSVVYALVAVSLLISFEWLKFPDLTPDASFVVGAVGYVFAVTAGAGIVGSFAVGAACGAGAGVITALLNRWGGVPTVIASLLVVTGLYSINWLVLGRPNQYLLHTQLIANGDSTSLGQSLFLFAVATVLAVFVVLVVFFGNTVFGLRARALGENPSLARDLKASMSLYTAVLLGLANAGVALAGIISASRSFSVDINSGVGITLSGLAAMIIGLSISRGRTGVTATVLMIVLGAFVYRTLIFGALYVGLPAELFRLLSALLLVGFFLAFGHGQQAFLRQLRWR